MVPARLTAWTIVAALAAFSAVGCCQKEKEQISQLTKDNNELANTNQELKSELAQARDREAQLQAQLTGKDAEISAAREQGTRPPKGGDVRTTGTASGWEPTLGGDKVTVGADILFAPGKAALTSAGEKKMDKIIADLKGTYANLPIRVYGYTDSDPIRKTKNLWDDNLDLSANRAMAVTRYIVAKGVPADRIETVAMGQTHPVARNASKDAKAKNRRVEIIVVKAK